MARNLYDQLRGNSLRALGYQDGGDVSDGQPDGATGQWQPSQPSIFGKIANALSAPGSPVAETLKTLQGGRQAMSASQGTGATLTDAYGNWVERGANRMGQGWTNATTPGASWEQRRVGLSDMIRGAEPIYLPAEIPSLAAHPLLTLGVDAASYGAATGAEAGLQKLGVSPGWSQLAGDVAGLIVGEPVEAGVSGMAKGGPVLRGMRQKTLDALRYADGGPVDQDSPGPVHSGNAGSITLDPDAIQRELRWHDEPPVPANKIRIDPDAVRGQSFAVTPNPRQWPPAPKPAPPPVKADTSFNPNLDLQLGFQSGLGGLANMIYKPAEDLYGGRLASGQTLSQATTGQLGPDPTQIAARSEPFQRAVQFAGRMPADAARYGLATVAAGGNPVLGAAAADALGAETPGEAVTSGLKSAALAGLLHYGPSAVPQVAQKAISILPSREELAAAGEAANARLRASGVYSGANAAIGLDPATLRDLSISTGAQLGSGMWTVGEAAAARAQQVKNWLLNARQEGLSAEEMDKFNAARQTSPELNQYGDMMTPLEVRKVIASPENVESFSRLMQALPQDYQLAASAKMGIPKLGWYYGSAHAIHDIFGSDGPRFAQLLAAMSPKTSVESNLYNALNTWKNWVAEGRPADADAIKQIMARSVQGGTEKSALHAWVPNSISVLSAEDPMGVTLSGPKVDSFYHDLRNDVFKLAQDAWMANSYGIAQDAFQGAGANVLAGNPGMTPEYAAANARLRAAGLQTGMLPTQGQETAWSTAMQLYELARKKNMDPRDVLQKGLLTPEIIAGAPDFSRLLKEPKYADVLEQAGYGPQVSAMQPAPPVRIASTPAELAAKTGTILPPNTGVAMSPSEQEAMMHMAGILAETRGMRQRATRAAQFPVPPPQPASIPGNLQMEWYPGPSTGIYPEIQPPNPRLPWGSSAATTSRFMAPFENQRSQNALLTAAGLKTIPTENVVGAYTPPSGLAQVNPARSYGFEAPLIRTAEGNLAVDPQAMANIRGAGTLQSYMLGQEATGIPVMLRDPMGEDFSMRLPEKPATTPQEVQALQQAYPKKAIIHTGPRLHVLNIGDVPMDQATRDNMLSMMRATEGERATNIGDYMDDAEAWAKGPGSGAATQRVMDRVDQMTPEAQAAADAHVRYQAGKTLAAYRQKIRTQKWTGRPDFENALEVAANQGIPGLRQGLKTGAFLPGLVGAIALPYLLSERDYSGQAAAGTPR